MAGLPARAVKGAAKAVGARPEAYADDLSATIGNPGIAQAGLVLADVLDRAEPGQIIALVQLADGVRRRGCSRTTEALARRRPDGHRARSASRPPATTSPTPRSSPGGASCAASRRAAPSPTARLPRRRCGARAWKYGFVGSRDEGGFVHLPPSRVSMESGAIDQMDEVRMADVPATIATYTVDRLAYSLSPPVVAAVIDFDGGGRFQCELTDVDPSTVKIGDRVEMTFRRLYTAQGIHDYFWKARPVRGAP